MHPKRPLWQLVAYSAVLLLLCASIAVLRPQPVLSDEGLTSLVNAAYGARTEDSGLHAIAHERAVEVSTDWSHNGRRDGTAEVLAYNSGFADPASKAVEQWMGSPDHHTILSDPSYTRIGCGSYSDGVTTWFACVLAGPVVTVAPPAPQPTPATSPAPRPATGPAPTPQPVTLPDTALPWISGDGDRKVDGETHIG